MWGDIKRGPVDVGVADMKSDCIFLMIMGAAFVSAFIAWAVLVCVIEVFYVSC